MRDMLFTRSPGHKQLALLSSLAVIVLFLLFGTLPEVNLLWRELQNTGHTLLFIPVAILTLLLVRNTRHYAHQRPFAPYLAAFAISLLIGVMIELAQYATHRDASIIDVARDLAGIITGLGLYASIDPTLQTNTPRQTRRIRSGLVMLSVFILIAGLLPLGFLSAAYAQREMALPRVVDLSTGWEQPFIRLHNASIQVADDEESQTFKQEQLARVDLETGAYPGFSIIETYPDWSGYAALKLTVYSKLAQDFNIVLRIHDAEHNYAYNDRFNRELTIHQGANSFYIPLEAIKNAPADRPMDMTRIKELSFFSPQPAEGLYFYVGDVRLQKMDSTSG